MEPEMPLQPGSHLRMFMGPIVVHDEMEIEAGLSFDVDLLEKPDKLLMPMAR